MSYILDALQRADAQRQRGAVPGLHARQVLTPTPTSPSTSGVAARAGWITAMVLLLGGLGAGLWLWGTQADNAQVATANPASLPAPERNIAAPSAPAPIAPAPAPARTSVVQPPPVAQTSAPAEPLPTPAKSGSESRVAQPQAKVDTKANAKVGAEAKNASPPETAVLWSELPEHIRSQIPPLTITGAVYSQDPGQRLLLVNAQVLAQGSQVAPELSLVEIRARSSEFSFRGTRFRLAH